MAVPCFSLVRRFVIISLKAIDVGNLAARLEMLETVLKLRNGDSQQ
jgi:hypothetical protein